MNTLGFNTPEKHINKAPRTSVWHDSVFQKEKGGNLAYKFRHSLITGTPLYYAPILPAIKIKGEREPFSRDPFSIEQTSCGIFPDENHPFTVAFVEHLGLEEITDLVNRPHGEIDFLYLANGSIEFDPIKRVEDYTAKEINSLVDGVYLPAVRVLFVPEVV